MAGGITKSITSLAYVANATRFIALAKHLHTCDEFFEMVQGCCNLLADLSLVIKMGRNVKKCTLYLYNIPYDVPVPEFYSVAWSYDAQGPAQGIIKTVVMRRDREGNLICYDVPKMIQNQVYEEILNILAPYKYLGITYNEQLDPNIGKEKMIQKMAQRIALIAHRTPSIQETTILHNMLVCQVAIFSPICAYFSLADCEKIWHIYFSKTRRNWSMLFYEGLCWGAPSRLRSLYIT
jgi:hypothetical protein